MITSEDLAYGKLKTMILDGEFPAGKFLSQRMLAEKADAVVITVRSSLRRLENEDLIENVPKWGVRIPEDTPEKIRDRYFMRETLEIAAIKRIRGKGLLTDELKCRLEKAAAACDSIYPDSGQSLKEFAALHADFHLLIAEVSGSELLLNAVNRINMRSIMFFNAKRVWLKQQPSASFRAHHQNYLKLLTSIPAEKIEEAVRAHTARGMEMELKCLENDKII